MKLAFCSEDRTDIVILHALVERCVGEPVETANLPAALPSRQGGWSKALALAPKVVRNVFNSDAHGAVLVIDCDETLPHDKGHVGQPARGCRHCELARAADVATVLAWERPMLPPLQCVIGVPVRMLETWLLVATGTFPRNESSLVYGRNSAERRALKFALWREERPTRELMIERGKTIVQNADIPRLTTESPSFAWFRDELIRAHRAVLGWTPPPPA
ncbi:MAG: hypothetical protein MUC96_01535 [Myxococcaceae bacterium]|nr:hypothetical protein [Myxococcaceae bacterium]